MQSIIVIKLTAPQSAGVVVQNSELTHKQRVACELNDLWLSMPAEEDVPNYGLYLPL